MNQLELLQSTVAHKRFFPKQHIFSYNVFYVVAPVTESTVFKPRLFAWNAPSLFSLYTRDHGARSDKSWRSWITEVCAANGLTLEERDNVLMISHPRLFGYAFNPISFWLIYKEDRYLQAVLCEVNNTFGDNHNYFLAHEDFSAISKDDTFTAVKKLYVSPFNTMSPAHYTFMFDVATGTFKAVINYYQDGVHVLNAFMGGVRTPLSSRAIFLSALKYPLMTILVVLRIHWQAVRLYLKGIKHTLTQRPQKTFGDTSRGSTHETD